MKKFFVLVVFLLAEIYGSARTTYDIDENVKKSFHVLFPHAQGASWSEYPDTYMVYFINDGIQERVFYAKDGSFIELIRYYNSDGLPANIQLMLKDRLPEKKIYGVIEVSTLNRLQGGAKIQYQVTMEDAHCWYKVIVDNDEAPYIVSRNRK